MSLKVKPRERNNDSMRDVDAGGEKIAFHARRQHAALCVTDFVLPGSQILITTPLYSIRRTEDWRVCALQIDKGILSPSERCRRGFSMNEKGS